MSNMGYCRFENTLRDLQDCKDALHENELIDLEGTELECAKQLIQMCTNIAGRFYCLIKDEDDEE